MLHSIKQSAKHFFFLGISILVLTTSRSQVDTSKSAFYVPEKQNKWINDIENIFSDSEQRILDSLVRSFERSTSIEIVVITFDSTYTTAENFDNFVLTIHNRWEVGKKESNNGIVIGVSRSLRKIRISNGYGIEKRMNDLETKKTIEEVIIPEFKNSNYFEGVKKGIQALIKKLQ
jgi:uncharacterized protein